MKSPRFVMREAEIKPVFSSGALKNAWKNKVRATLRDQYLLDPIEHLDFHVNLGPECDNIQEVVCSADYRPGASKRILLEKSKGLCRQIVIPTVRDSVVLQCLSDALYADIKGKAPTKKSFFEPADHQFSKLQKGIFGEPAYGSFRAWLDFQKAIFQFSKNREYIVVTDIANYYDSISYLHLRNVIAGLIEVRESVLDMLIFTLSGLLWQPDYMPRVEIGLPQMDLDAPRILAHCYLYELDQYLDKTFGGDYVRYMDDIDIGVDSITDAKLVLRDIDLVLQARQVRLNTGKTQILRRKEAFAHFRIRENAFLDRLIRHIDGKLAKQQSISREQQWIRKSIKKTYPRRFDTGNGEKILRRLLGIAAKIDVDIPPPILEDILIRRPTSRSSALRVLSRFKITPARATVLSRVLASGYIVDDATYLQIAYALVEGPAVSTKLTSAFLPNFLKQFRQNDFAQLYALIWIMSKFSTANEIYSIVKDTYKVWQVDTWLGRLIGGLTPTLLGTVDEPAFIGLIAKSRNVGALEVSGFHQELRSDAKRFGAISKILAQPNTSKPLGITHAKFLLLLSALANPSVPPAVKTNLIQAHSVAWRDRYYRRRAKFVVVPLSLRFIIK